MSTSLRLSSKRSSHTVTTSIDDQCIIKVFFDCKVLRTRFYFFSKLSLISISEGGKGPQFPGIQESSGGTIWNEWAFFSRLPYGLQCRQTRKYNDDHLVNSTTLFTTFTTGLFLASDSERACLTDRFLFFHHFFFTWRLGLRRSSVSRITTVRRTRIRRYYAAALHNSDFLFICLCLPKKCFTFVWRIHVSATL